MELWNKVSQPPPSALTKIKGGRLAGFTDVKPQWRIKIMTEVYGMCGIGWKFEVKRLWTEQGPDSQVFSFADVDLFIKQDGEWSEAIPGNGGNMLIAKEKNGLHSSDEAFKMAITDALSSAMKMIGVAADIYMGNWDGSKYKIKKPVLKKEITIGNANMKDMQSFCTKNSITTNDAKSAFLKHYKIDVYKTTVTEFNNIFEQVREDYANPS